MDELIEGQDGESGIIGYRSNANLRGNIDAILFVGRAEVLLGQLSKVLAFLADIIQINVSLADR